MENFENPFIQKSERLPLPGQLLRKAERRTATIWQCITGVMFAFGVIGLIWLLVTVHNPIKIGQEKVQSSIVVVHPVTTTTTADLTTLEASTDKPFPTATTIGEFPTTTANPNSKFDFPTTSNEVQPTTLELEEFKTTTAESLISEIPTTTELQLATTTKESTTTISTTTLDDGLFTSSTMPTAAAATTSTGTTIKSTQRPTKTPSRLKCSRVEMSITPLQQLLDKRWMCARCEVDARDGLYQLDREDDWIIWHNGMFQLHCFQHCFKNKILVQCAKHLYRYCQGSRSRCRVGSTVSSDSINCSFCKDLND